AAAARVVVAPEGQVVVEGTVRDRGRGGVGQAPADRGADLAIPAGAAGGVGTADGLVGRERTAAKIERPEVDDATATGEPHSVRTRAGPPVAAVAGDSQVA